MLITNRFIHKLLNEKEKGKFFKTSLLFKCSIMTMQIHFQSNYFIYIYILNLYMSTSWKKKFKLFFFFSFGQSMENIMMVKVGYFCMKQRMIWDNFVMFPFIKFIPYILCQQIQLSKLYN